MKELLDLGILNNAIDSFKNSGCYFEIFSEIKPEPKMEDFLNAKKIVRKENFDVIVGFGGGSCIDFAKALAILANHKEDIWDYVNLSNKPPKEIFKDKVLPVIAVPTTSGTGSEVTPFSVVINPETNEEGTIKDSAIFPRIAVIDPMLIRGLPRAWTAITGIDAFSHALESYFNLSNRTPYSDMICLEAMRWIVKYLPLAYEDGSNIEARSGVCYGAMLGGLSIALSGTTVGHALVHPTDALIGTPHGVSVSIYMISVLKYTLPTDVKRFEKIVKIFENREFQNDQDIINTGLKHIKEFLEGFDYKKRLSDYSDSEDIIHEIVDDAWRYMYRPLNQHVKKFSKNELTKIVKDSY